MRVLFVNPAAELGGSERSLLDLLASLGACGARLERRLLLLADGELARRARSLGVEVDVIALPETLAGLGESKSSAGRGADVAGWLRAFGSLPGYAARLRRALSAFRPDVVHTNGMKAHLLAALIAPDYQRVVHLRDFAADRSLSRRALPIIGWRALVVSNSRAVEDDARALVASLNVRTIYNGIDVDEFRTGPRDTGALAALAGLPPPPDDAVIVGLVATYAWWKGHRTFIAAAARVVAAAKRPVRFYIVGGPIYRTAGSEIKEAELRAAISAAGLEGHVGLVPFQRDVAPVYRGLDVLVHASERREPFGRTIVEAMACERAVVVANAGGAAELFREGETGLGFRPGDAADLARAVLEVVENDSKRLAIASAARADAVARFDRRRLGPELLAVYEELGRRGAER